MGMCASGSLNFGIPLFDDDFIYGEEAEKLEEEGIEGNCEIIEHILGESDEFDIITVDYTGVCGECYGWILGIEGLDYGASVGEYVLINDINNHEDIVKYHNILHKALDLLSEKGIIDLEHVYRTPNWYLSAYYG